MQIVTLLLSLLGLSVLLVGCSEKDDFEKGVHAYSCLNSQGDILAILVGLKPQGEDRPAGMETYPVLLKLNNQAMLDSVTQIDDWVLQHMAWRPLHDNHLYYSTFERCYGYGPFYEPRSKKFFARGTGRFLMYDADLIQSTQVSHGSATDTITWFQWSPDGSMLAGLVTNSAVKGSDSGKLVISYDGGVTCERTEISMFGRPVWVNNNELYLMTDHHHNKIVKVSSDDPGARITGTFLQSDCEIILNGLLDGKLVYTAYPRKAKDGRYLDKSRRLFVGDRLLYETDNPLFRIFTFPEKIVAEVDKRILIFDERLSVCHEKPLDLNTHILDFHPATNRVFLVKGWKTILCYDYTKEDEPHALFNVNMLDE